MRVFKKWLFVMIVAAMAVITTACVSSDDKKGEAAKSAESAKHWTCSMHPEVVVDEPGQCPKCGMNLIPTKEGEHKHTSGEMHDKQNSHKGNILYWMAPMDSTERYNAPGKSKMGMDLIPVYDEKDLHKK